MVYLRQLMATHVEKSFDGREWVQCHMLFSKQRDWMDTLNDSSGATGYGLWEKSFVEVLK